MFVTEPTHAVMSLPTLTLTSSIKEAAKPGIFIGRINEISGIYAQGSSREEVYDDLVRNTAIMLPSKKKEALELLKKQNLVSSEQPESEVHFRHKVRELETA
jgi:predicted RNase H-like HicB family nuclease